FFSLSTRPPPRSTRSPYATLFRSGLLRRHSRLISFIQRALDCVLIAAVLFLANTIYGNPWSQLLSYAAILAVVSFQAAAPLTGLDRKSTRLNSSHVKISYAVFCLK